MIYQFMVFPIDVYWFLFLYVFAIIEFIYYHTRLPYLSMNEMKDFIRQGGLRSSKLADELKKLST